MATITGKTGKLSYEFGQFRLLPSERLLLREGKPVQLQPKVFDALVLLVESDGRLIEKDYLLNRLWPDTFVEEGTLARTISSLRKALGDGTQENKYIETVSKSGYRFVAAVKHINGDDADSSLSLSFGLSYINKTEESLIVRDKVLPPVDRTEHEISDNKYGFLIQNLKPRFLLVVALIVVLGSVIAFVIFRQMREVKKTSAKSIAVLPFKFIGEQEDARALEVGMADALIIKLSKAKQIVVRPTSSVFKYAGKYPDPATAGRELKVDVVLDGSIQKDGDRLRVTVQLINSADGTPVWADKFDSRATDIFAVQDNISAQITQALEVQLTGAEKQQIAKRDTQNMEAYLAYNKGRYLWNKRNAADLQKSLEFFEQAVQLDPNYALAYTGIADCYQLFAESGFSYKRKVENKAVKM